MITLPEIDLTGKTLSQVALEIAISQLGVHESNGNNRGPEVDLYIQSVGLDPAGDYPWCASFMYYCFSQAARMLGIVNPFPRTGKAVNIWNLADPICRDSNPSVGAIYILDDGKNWVKPLQTGDRLTDNGHAGIAELVDVNGQLVSEISGNTNAAGSRDGNSVWRHVGTPEASHKGMLIGWLQFDRAPTRAVV